MTFPAAPRRRKRGVRAGTAVIEFALLMPALLLVVFGIVELSRGVWTQSALQFAVEKAARCAALNAAECGTPQQVQQYAASEMLAPGATAATFTYSAAPCGSLVSARMPFAFLVRLVYDGGVTLTAKSCYPA